MLVVGRQLPSHVADEGALIQASMDLLAAMIATVPGQHFWQHKRYKNYLGRARREVEPWKQHGFRLLADPLQALPPTA